MTRAATKERERTILRVVYPDSEAARFVEGEQPDFTASIFEGEVASFGVEVTELYLSESHARLQNLPSYSSEIFAGRYRHSKDRLELPVEEVTLERHGGTTSEKLSALIQRFPDVTDHLRLIANAIAAKALKAHRYRSLHHLNLIIVDNIRRWGKLDTASLCRLLTSEHVPAAIWRSPFREVFYVASLKDGWVYVPLVSNCMLAELFGFVMVVAPHLDLVSSASQPVLSSYAHHIRRRSRGPVLCRGEGAQYEVLHRRYGLLLSETEGVVVRDYLDFPYPNDSRPVEGPDTLPFSRRVLSQRLRRHHETHSFTCDITVPAKNLPPAARSQSRTDA